MAYRSNSNTLASAILERLSTAIHPDTSDPHRISIGIGGDIPIFPPLAFLLSLTTGLLGWAITRKRYRIVPKTLSPIAVRGIIVAVGIGVTLSLVNACQDELSKVGTIANFDHVTEVATRGPFAYTRNGMYLSLFILQISLCIGLDTAWIGISLAMFMMYIDLIVVPAEERFLAKEIGEKYVQYCERVPRWLL